MSDERSTGDPARDAINRMRDFVKSEGKEQQADTEGKRVIKKKGKRILVVTLLTLAFAFIYFYVKLPAINLKDKEFLYFILVVCLFYFVVIAVTSGFHADNSLKSYVKFGKKSALPALILGGAAIVILLLGSLVSLKIFWAGKYSSLIKVETGEFTSDVGEISFDSIPILDAASAGVLGDRTLGELSDMVSQFEVSATYNQINYSGRPVRVTYLLYGDIIKWWNNFREGIPGYIIVDMTTQEASFVRLESKMRYSPSEYFGRDLTRYLRFSYPTYMFETPTFEIDDSGECYWICPRVKKTVGWFGGTDVVGVVLLNACTGESTYYDAGTAPEWIDHVYNDALIVEQYNNYGRLHNGWLNSLLGQKDVTVTSSGTNYIAMNDDVYMYTGVTSVGNDQANVGFILTNQRTKATKFYQISGATETSAMRSAEGVVQHLAYDSAFPLLLNVSEQPTYFMALKDSASLVKMFAMVNVQQYQIVATGATVAECRANYTALLAQNGITVTPAVEGENAPEENYTTAEGVVAEVRSAVREGDSYYLIRLQNEDVFYLLDVSDSWLPAVLSPGDSVVISWDGSEAVDGVIAAERIDLG